MDTVMRDASGESLNKLASSQDILATPSQDSDHDLGAGSGEDIMMSPSEELQHLLASVPHPAPYSPAQISLHEQSTLVPHTLIVSQPPQQSREQPQQSPAREQPQQSPSARQQLQQSPQQSPSSQQQQELRPALQSRPAPTQTGMFVNLNPDQAGQHRHLNPQTGQIIGQETGQDSSVQPGQVLLQQTGQIFLHGAGHVVTSSEEPNTVPVQASERGQGSVSADTGPLKASKQEEDTDVVSSTLNADVLGVSNKKTAEPTKRELKYKRKYQTSVIDNTKVKLQLLERERQLEVAEQEVDELRKRLKEMENLLKWEKSLGEVAGAPGSAHRRRGIIVNYVTWITIVNVHAWCLVDRTIWTTGSLT